uniref:PGG domain-containing protein n=1 Tax=Solanum tuberosum TaxID=4113 RepID=M1C528_SOLTU
MSSDDNDTRMIKRIRDAAQTHIVVAALLVTVTFAAGFTLPGGFESDKDSLDKGMAILTKKSAFCAFVVTDAIAFVCSAGAVFSYFVMAAAHGPTIKEELRVLLNIFVVATILQFLSMSAVVIAFVTGLYATLANSVGLAAIVCVIGCLAFLIYVLVFYLLHKCQ